jgi:hypothetical protein
MSNSTLETITETTPKRSIEDLLYYYKEKDKTLQSKIESNLTNDGLFEFTFTRKELATESQIVDETIERLQQAKEDEEFYKEVFEMFNQLTKTEKNKTLVFVKRVIESQVNNNDSLKALADLALEGSN